MVPAEHLVEGKSEPPFEIPMRKEELEALRRLGVDWAEVRKIQSISPVLAECGERDQWWEWIANAHGPEAQKINEQILRVTPGDLPFLSVEALCVAAEVDPAKLLAQIIETAVDNGRRASLLIAAIKMPKIVERTAEIALTPGGGQERKMLLQHSEFLPLPKTTVVNSRHTHIDNSHGKTIQTALTFAAPESSIKRFTDRFNEQIIEAEMVEPAEELSAEAKFLTSGSGEGEPEETEGWIPDAPEDEGD